MRKKLKKVYTKEIGPNRSEETDRIKAGIFLLHLLGEFPLSNQVNSLLENFEILYQSIAVNIYTSIEIVDRIQEEVFQFFMVETGRKSMILREIPNFYGSAHDRLPFCLSKLVMSYHDTRSNITVQIFLEICKIFVKLIPADFELYEFIAKKTLAKDENLNGFLNFNKAFEFFQCIYGKGFKFFKALCEVYPLGRTAAPVRISIKFEPTRPQLDTAPFVFRYECEKDAVIILGKYPLCDIPFNGKYPDLLSAIIYLDNCNWYIKDCSKKHYSFRSLVPNISAELRPDMLFLLSTKIMFLIGKIEIRDETHSSLEFFQKFPFFEKPKKIKSSFLSKRGNKLYYFGSPPSRSPKLDYIINENKEISKLHAHIKYESGIWYLTGLDSKNGTHILFKSSQELDKFQPSHPYKLFQESASIKVCICTCVLNIEIN